MDGPSQPEEPTNKPVKPAQRPIEKYSLGLSDTNPAALGQSERPGITRRGLLATVVAAVATRIVGPPLVARLKQEAQEREDFQAKHQPGQEDKNHVTPPGTLPSYPPKK